MKLKVGVPIVICLLILSTVGYQGFRSYEDIRNFRDQLASRTDFQALQNQSSRISKDVDFILSVTNFPVVKNFLDLFGLNFAKVKPEISSLTISAPFLLGADRPKKYLIAFQNSAEARGTGGILGAFAVLEFKDGNLSVLQTGSNEVLYQISKSVLPISVPAEYKRLYGNQPAILQNSNLSPHFPYGSEIWLELWRAKFGENLDGVIAIDPTALSYVLRATGPITLGSGEKITSESLVRETLKDAYKRYEFDNPARKQYLVKIMNATVKRLLAGNYSKVGMAKAIRDGIVENRILIYSRDLAVEKQISKNRLGGYMGTKANNEFRVVVQNIDASKLDYYIRKSVAIESKSCGAPHQTEVKVHITNTLKSGKGLPSYVLTRDDKGKPESLVTGAHRFKLFIYGPTKSRLLSVSRENRSQGLGGASTERGRPIYVADVDLKPGESENLLANFGGGVGKISFVDQPLVIPTELSIKGGC
jgi:Protein of unknown function (DUF4012)